MKLNLYYVRHGQSYANKYSLIHCFICDPSLTKFGIVSSENSNIPENPDYILCSELLRAKQTASCAYPERFLYVTPHTGELGLGLDNISSGFENQYSNLELAKFIHLPHDDQCKNFNMYLEKHFVKSNINKDELNIVLFTHKRFISKMTKVKCAKNNQVVLVSYTY